MAIRKWNQRTIHRHLYAGNLEKITLLKRGPDQQQGTVVSLILYQCRPQGLHRTYTGQPIQGSFTSDDRLRWQIPRTELDRVGVQFISADDRIVDEQNRYWMPESTTSIDVRLFELFVFVACLRADPSNNKTAR